MPAAGEIGIDPVLERREPQLLEPNDLRLGERLPGEVGERGPAPEGERRAQGLAGRRRVTHRERRSPFPAEPDELEQVDSRRIDHEPVTGRRRLEGAVRQELPQLRDVDLDRVPGCVRGLLAPERIDQAIAGDDLVRLQQESGQQRPALLAAERDRLTVEVHRERTEELELRTTGRHRRFLARFQRSFSAPSALGATIAA